MLTCIFIYFFRNDRDIKPIIENDEKRLQDIEKYSVDVGWLFS